MNAPTHWEEFTLVSSETIGGNLEIERPFTLRAVADKPAAFLNRSASWLDTGRE